MTLREFLISVDMIPEELAIKAGVSPSTMWKLLRGDPTVRRRTAKRVAAATGGALTTDDIMGELLAKAPQVHGAISGNE